MKRELDRQYMMPVHFGPATGPRQTPEGGRFINHPKARSRDLTVVYETDGELLASILPDSCKLTAPLVGVRISELRQVPWLAGRGYNVAMILIPAEFRGQETRRGFFVPVLWESHGDPVITGREQLGWNKIYGQVSDFCGDANSMTSVTSSWGFPFLKVCARLDQAPPAPAELQALLGITMDPEGGFLHHKYIPTTDFGPDGGARPDADYMTFLPFAWSEPPAPAGVIPDVPVMHVGNGTVEWREPSWEDMPTQYRIAGFFARLPVSRVLGAIHTVGYTSNDLLGQRILR